MKKWMLGGLIAVVALIVLVVTLGSHTMKREIYAQALPESYFSAFDHIKPNLYQVSGSTYAFEREFARSLVIRTSEGIAIFDTFDIFHMKSLKQALEKQFPGEPVRWIVYSHNHLDHIRGSNLFPEAEVIGHEDVNELVADWPKVTKDVSAVTREIAGDKMLTLGDVEVEMTYMPFSHSHTLYGIYVPADDVVFASDMMFVNAVPPFGFPDFYYPGYIRALDRLIAMDAKHYVPSHMDRGTRDDLIAYRNMTVEFQNVIEDEFLKIDPEQFPRGVGMRNALRSAYDRLLPKYKDVHGFDDMFVPKFGRHFGGTYLGY